MTLNAATNSCDNEYPITALTLVGYPRGSQVGPLLYHRVGHVYYINCQGLLHMGILSVMITTSITSVNETNRSHEEYLGLIAG